MTFKELGIGQELLDALGYMGFVDATPIQEQAIPAIIEGKDILACAQTGTGKTGAYLLPVLNRLIEKPIDGTSTVIVAPTRELAIQIDQQIQGFCYFSGIESIAIYGGGDGSNWDQQKRALTKGADIIVATPGKLISHLNLGYVKFDQVKYLILDEADRMLDIGFHDDIMKIITYLPKERQTLLFSATMPPKITTLSKKIANDPMAISIAISKPAEGILQAAYLVHDSQKNQLINGLIKDKPKYESIIVFTSTKKKVGSVVKSMKGKGYDVKGISSDLSQEDRIKVLQQFKAKKTRVIVSTDVLSRGIDIKDINLVVNYDVPGDAEDYVHRIGRTARASTTGVAITFVNSDDMHKFAKIEKLIEKEVMKLPLPKEIGEGPKWNAQGGGGRGGFKGRKSGGKKNYSKKR